MNLDDLIKGVENFRKFDEQLDWLRNESFLHMIILKELGHKQEYDAYLEKCKADPLWYSFYANFHLKFWFKELEEQGKLRIGKKIEAHEEGEWHYEGQLDENDLCCG